MSEQNKIIIIENISKSYINGKSEVKVFDAFSLTVKRSETLAVTGPSGSGKTTLLNMIGGLDLPNAGKIEVNGEDIAKFADAELAQFRNREVGFVFQDNLLLPQCTLLENVLMPALPSTSDKTADEQLQRAEALLERVGLSKRANHFPAELSGGEKQRAAVVRALINEPSIILADEPTGALDRKNAENLVNLLNELNREFNVTIILATHSEHLAEKMKRSISVGQ